MRGILLFLIGFLAPTVWAQDFTLQGKIKGNTLYSDILVVNLNKQTQTKVAASGDFSIGVSVGDLLIISAPTIYKKRFLVEQSHINTIQMIPVEAKSIEIEQVEIIRPNITPESLGLVPKNQKRYTVAERRLKAATEMNLMLGFGLSMSLDPIINAISGRTKMLKQELKIERYNARLKAIRNYLTNETIVDDFKIPQEYAEDFRVFLADNAAFSKVLATKNRNQILTHAFMLVESYNKLIAHER